MVDWENLRHFAALAEFGTLSAAARRLGVEHATISRRIARLEAELGLKLVDRRGRRLRLTEDGERVAAAAREMEDAAAAIERAKAGRQSILDATITISAPPAYAASRLVGPLAALRRLHPGIRLRIIGETRQASLDRREADIAVRLSRPSEGDLTMVKIGIATFRLFATPAYLASTPPEAWSFIAYGDDMNTALQQAELLSFAKGRHIDVRANTLEIQLAFAKADAGVVMLPDFISADANGLVEIVPQRADLFRDVWLVFHTDMKDALAVRAVVAALRHQGKAVGT